MNNWGTTWGRGRSWLGRTRRATGISGVSRDATSSVYVPASAGEWTTFRAAAALACANPNSTWLCQEGSGDLADAVGALTLVANGSPTYQQAVTGWTRTAVQFNETASQRIGVGAGVGPNPSTTSQFWLWFIKITAAPTDNRTVVSISNGATDLRAQVTPGPVWRIDAGATLTSGADDPSNDGVQPIGLLLDRTGTRTILFTGKEKIVGTYSSPSDGFKGLAAGSTAVSFKGQVLYGAMWSGANAELSDANVKALYQALGFEIPWT